ncbi:MAG: hypothetical protein QNJ63_19880 [Calothrix sp. MO_192.B10]|nr:hypothetical protein [Calothrix sp. MO_192.B10]
MKLFSRLISPQKHKFIQQQRHQVERPPSEPIFQQITIALSNRPFLFVIGIYQGVKEGRSDG